MNVRELILALSEYQGDERVVTCGTDWLDWHTVESTWQGDDGSGPVVVIDRLERDPEAP